MRDVVIIGAGPAGLSAALWCDELGLDTLALEAKPEVGGQLLWVYNEIKNHLGVRAANGRELRDMFAAQAADAKFDLRTEARIERIDVATKRVELQSGEHIRAACLIIATGVRRRKLRVPGEAELAGRGVFQSATRERAQLAGRSMCVIGGGDAAAENALLLAEVCPTVTLVHRGRRLSARPAFVERLRASRNIEVFMETVVRRIIGDEQVEGVELLRVGAAKSFEVAVGGVLARIGVEPNTELFGEQLKLDACGYVAVTSETETSAANVFAIGDVSNPLAPTISTAVGAGATAAKVIAARLQTSAR